MVQRLCERLGAIVADLFGYDHILFALVAVGLPARMAASPDAFHLATEMYALWRHDARLRSIKAAAPFRTRACFTRRWRHQ